MSMMDSVLDDDLYEAAAGEAEIVRKARRKARERGESEFDNFGRYTRKTLRDMGIPPNPLWFEIVGRFIAWVIITLIVYSMWLSDKNNHYFYIGLFILLTVLQIKFAITQIKNNKEEIEKYYS